MIMAHTAHTLVGTIPVFRRGAADQFGQMPESVAVYVHRRQYMMDRVLPLVHSAQTLILPKPRTYTYIPGTLLAGSG